MLIVFHIFIHHWMRIFNLNAPVVFLGLVLGWSAGLPSHFNLF